jgi:hypothetical protein
MVSALVVAMNAMPAVIKTNSIMIAPPAHQPDLPMSCKRGTAITRAMASPGILI